MLHVAVAWILLVGSFSAVGFVAYQVLLMFPALPGSAVTMIGSVVLVGVVTALLGVVLFSLTWFGYLRACIAAERRERLEESVKRYMQVQLMEPIYGKTKELVYGRFGKRA